MQRLFWLDSNLCQGGCGAELPDEVTAVLSLVHEPEFALACRDDGRIGLWFQIHDDAFPGTQWLATAVELLDIMITGGHRVYVHCVVGQSRSVMLCAAYLMQKLDLTREEALCHLVAVNERAMPNQSFLRGLKEWEAMLENRGKSPLQ